MTSEDRAVGALTWLWRALKGWSPQVLGVAATVFSLVWGSYSEKMWADGTWAFWTALGLLLAALVAQIFVQRPTYMRLEKDLRHAEETLEIERARLQGDVDAKSKVIADAMQVLLRKIAEYCNVDSNSDRISVYYYHEESLDSRDGRFVMLSRYALHPDYSRPGRTDYPVRQGAIGDAWEVGSIVVDLPSSRRRWEQRLIKSHGYTQEEAAALRMHCVSIAALRVEVDHRAVGVIVFESTEPETVTQDTIDTSRSSMLFATLSELVASAAVHTPRGAQLVGPSTAPAQRPTPAWKETKPQPAR